MAIDHTLFCRTTETIIQPTKAKFFPTDIPIPHPQLRHFISTAENDWIYFAADYDIYCLHVPSQRKRLLITLPFTPRCLAAGESWICAGGDNHGDCAFIKVRRADAAPMDVDSLLPLDSSNLNSKTSTSGTETATFPDLKQPELVLEQMGGYIVNSITVHNLVHGNDVSEAVAVISNNDKTVKIFSLIRRQQIAELEHSNAMNYAMISPDSNVLVAVGDENAVYFYRRELNSDQIDYVGGRRLSNYRWKLFATPTLPSDGHPPDDCCFTIAFSPTGHLCAVAAQNGIITVFDMNVLSSETGTEYPERSVLCNFRSSRPLGSTTGAVRSMAFSPEPWDLLLWAEEYGRAGIADVREAFTRRQIIKLETHAPGIDRVTLEDITDPSLRELDPESRMLHQFQETLGLDDDDPESRHWLRRGLSRHHSHRIPYVESRELLTERERRLIESIRTSRTGDEAAEVLESLLPNPRQTPYSVNYTSSPRVRASLAQADENRARSARLRAMLSQFVRTMDAERSEDRSYQPRRRSSIVLSQGSQSTERLAPSSDTRLRVTASPSRLSQSEMDIDSGPAGVSTTLEASGAFSLDEPENAERHSLPRTRYPQDYQELLIQLEQRNRERRQRNETMSPSATLNSAQPTSQTMHGGGVTSEPVTRLHDSRSRYNQSNQSWNEFIDELIEGRDPWGNDQHPVETIQRERRPTEQRTASERPSPALAINGLRSSSQADGNSIDTASPTAWRDILHALEPFDPTGIPLEQMEAERARYQQRADAVMDYARRLRHVIFAGEDSSEQTSALPTANLRSRSTNAGDNNVFTGFRPPPRSARDVQEMRRRSQMGLEMEANSLSHRPSTPSNPTGNRDRSVSPNSFARWIRPLPPASANPSSQPLIPISTNSTPTAPSNTDNDIPTYAEAAEPRRHLDPSSTSPSNQSTLRARPSSTGSSFVASHRNSMVANSIRHARTMVMQNAASRMVDANGNWRAGDALLATARRTSDGVEIGSLESWSERGVGTAGVGWTPDGRHIYIGTEEGIFQYALNTADRMTFPSFTFR